MNVMQRQVQEFHREVLDGPTSPAEPMVRNPELRARLILEEAIETVIALIGDVRAFEEVRAAAYALSQSAKADNSEPNLVEVIDGVVDTIYVCLGTAEDIGIDLEPFFNEVHAANMRKRDPEHGQNASKNPLGKVIKPAGWTPPDIAGVLAKLIRDRSVAASEEELF